MPVSPVSVGDGRPWHNTLTVDGGGLFSLVGVANNQIVLHMEDVNNNYALYICTGTWNITNAAGGLADFTPSPADMTTGFLSKVGLYRTYPVVTLSTGAVPLDAQIIQVQSNP
jgi:hypothetical protein